MAIKKITQLPSGDSTLTADDVFPVVDIASNTTKRVSIGALSGVVGGGTGGVDSAGTIALIQDTVDSDYINARVETVNQGLDFGTFTSPSGITLDMGTF